VNNPSDPDMDPQQWIEAYRAIQIQGLPEDTALQEMVHAGLHKITAPFLRSKKAAKIFSRILGHHGPVALTLRPMHEAGFLSMYVPEFGRVASMRSSDESHRFVIGEHTLLAIEMLDEFKIEHPGGTRARYFEAFRNIRRPEVLYLATLLHDIGKGLGGDHEKEGGSLVPEICARLYLNEKDSKTVRFLVENHLLMAQTSQRRDLDDSATINGFVEKVGREERLHMLFLLTNADSLAVGSDSWNEWKETLLYELYIRSRRRFWEKARGIEQEGIPPLEVGRRAVDFLEPHISRRELEEHVEKMPASYFRFLHPKDLARHVELVHRVRVKKEAVALQWIQGTPGHCRTLMVCTRDRLGLFADIAGTLADKGLNILNASAYTREDGLVLDFFVVTQWRDSSACSPEKEWEVGEALKHMLNQAQDIKASDPILPAPPLKGRRERPLITVSNNVSRRFTVLEVEAHDAPGLLHAISRSLTRMGLDISLARVITEEDRALDVFYIADAGGGQILDMERLRAIKRALEEDLTGIPHPALRIKS